MSKWHYLACLSHEPPVTADWEISQHADDRLEAARRIIRSWSDTGRWHFDSEAPVWEPLQLFAGFLNQHRSCTIGIRSEYGDIEVVAAVPADPDMVILRQAAGTCDQDPDRRVRATLYRNAELHWPDLPRGLQAAIRAAALNEESP